jgi:hypothetical protein
MTTIGKIDVFDETQQSWGRMSNEYNIFSQQTMSTTIIKYQLC